MKRYTLELDFNSVGDTLIAIYYKGSEDVTILHLYPDGTAREQTLTENPDKSEDADYWIVTWPKVDLFARLMELLEKEGIDPEA